MFDRVFDRICYSHLPCCLIMSSLALCWHLLVVLKHLTAVIHSFVVKT